MDFFDASNNQGFAKNFEDRVTTSLICTPKRHRRQVMEFVHQAVASDRDKSYWSERAQEKIGELVADLPYLDAVSDAEYLNRKFDFLLDQLDIASPQAQAELIKSRAYKNTVSSPGDDIPVPIKKAWNAVERLFARLFPEAINSIPVGQNVTRIYGPEEEKLTSFVDIFKEGKPFFTRRTFTLSLVDDYWLVDEATMMLNEKNVLYDFTLGPVLDKFSNLKDGIEAQRTLSNKKLHPTSESIIGLIVKGSYTYTENRGPNSLYHAERFFERQQRKGFDTLAL